MKKDPIQNDAQSHENLKRIAQVLERPQDATEGQVARWVSLAGKGHREKPAHTGLLAGKFSKSRILHFRRWLIPAAAAAVVLIIWAGFNMPVSQVSANEVFDSIGKTFSSPNGISLQIKNLSLSEHDLNMEAYIGDAGQTLYADISAKPLPDCTIPPANLWLTVSRQGENAWILIRDLRCGKNDPLAGFIPANGGLMINWPMSDSVSKNYTHDFPVHIQLRNIQAMIESLRKASGDVKVIEKNGIVSLTGTIISPALLNAAALQDAVDTTEISDVFLPNALPFLTGRNMTKEVDRAAELTKAALSTKLSGEELEIAREQIELLALLARQKMQAESEESMRKQQKRLRRELEAKLTGAKFTILYDPDRKILLSVTLRAANENGGVVSVDFTGKSFHRAKLSRERFKDNSNIKNISRTEFMENIVFPMQLQSAIQGGWITE